MTDEKLAELKEEFERICKLTFNKLTLPDIDKYRELKEVIKEQERTRCKLAKS